MATNKFLVDEGIQVDNVRIAVSGNGEIDTSSGNLTLDSAGGTVAIDDILTVSSSASIAGNLTVSGTASIETLTVSGNLTVSGTTTTINTETINLADNQIVLNSNATGSPTESAGIEIERGDSTNVVLRWNETSDKWEITEDGTTYSEVATTAYVNAQTVASLDDIGDVSTASVSTGEFLKWNGSAWINSTILLDDINDVNTPSPSTDDLLKWDGAAWTNSTLALDGLSDVNATSPTTGHFLKWDGSAWVPAAATVSPTTTSITANAVTTIATFDKNAANAAELIVKVNQGNAYLSNKVLVLHNGTDADFVKYGEIAMSGQTASAGTIGATWTTSTITDSSAFLQSVSYKNNLWLVDGNYNEIMTSANGATWVTRTTPLLDTHAVEYANNIWLSGGQGLDYSLSKSTDAITWTTINTGPLNYLIKSVKYADSTWLVAGAYGKIWTSTDAITWVTQESNMSQQIRSVAYGNSLWVVAGSSGQIRTSTDTITWVTQTSASLGSSSSVVGFGNGIFVAGANYGELDTSTDGITWVSQNSGTSSISSINYDNGLWVAVGYDGVTTHSTDAITWITQSSGLGLLYSVGYGAAKWIASGQGGNIAYSNVDTSTSSITMTLSADISGSDVRLRANIADAATTTATTKVLATLVEE